MVCELCARIILKLAQLNTEMEISIKYKSFYAPQLRSQHRQKKSSAQFPSSASSLISLSQLVLEKYKNSFCGTTIVYAAKGEMQSFKAETLAVRAAKIAAGQSITSSSGRADMVGVDARLPVVLMVFKHHLSGGARRLSHKNGNSNVVVIV